MAVERNLVPVSSVKDIKEGDLIYVVGQNGHGQEVVAELRVKQPEHYYTDAVWLQILQMMVNADLPGVLCDGHLLVHDPLPTSLRRQNGHDSTST